MVSLDIKSLFTNIPIEETINIVCDKLFKNQNKFENFTKKEFEKLLRIATSESHFIFNEKFYDQIDGVAMGSPLAPTLANIFIHELELQYMNRLNELGVNNWLRYVDDIFLLIKDKKCCETILDFLNNIHPSIKFSSQQENDNELSFLDIKIKRTINGYKTSIYRKPTFTGVMINWNSLTSRSYKTALIKCLLNRAWKIVSSYEDLNDEIILIKQILIKNFFPIKIVDKVINRFLNEKILDIHKPKQEGKPHVVIILPHAGYRTEQFGSKFKQFINRYFPHINFTTIFKTPMEIRNLFPFKDKTPLLSRSNIVYKIKCDNCNGFYIGKTKRCLGIRIKEHQDENSNSSILKHAKDTGHQINWDQVEILDRADNDKLLLLKESIYIQNLNPTLNIHTQTASFSLILNFNTKKIKK